MDSEYIGLSNTLPKSIKCRKHVIPELGCIIPAHLGFLRIPPEASVSFGVRTFTTIKIMIICGEFREMVWRSSTWSTLRAVL